jgi:hypothetical protein
LALTAAFRLGHSLCRSVGAGAREDRAAPSASARHIAASCAIQLGTLSIVGSPRRTNMSEVGWKTEVCASSKRRGRPSADIHMPFQCAGFNRYDPPRS